MKDQKTHDYFNKFTPHFDPKRFTFAIDYLKTKATGEKRLIDIGCGDGATLYLISRNTPLTKFTGLDISENYLEKASQLVGCDTINSSILDTSRLQGFWGRFDYCTLGAVIHHLIGKDRQESFRYAEICLENTVKLLKPGGSLIIFEPTLGPSVMMDLVFWIKKFFGRFADQRIELFKRWANIGQPVVSYLTSEQLISYVERIPNTQILVKKRVDESRLGFVLSRVGMGIIVEKIA